MSLINCHNVSHSVGTKHLFSDINLTINDGDKIGLVGHNGCGKSTLLALISGKKQADEGEFSRNKQLQLAVVEQFIDDALLDLKLIDALAERISLEDRSFQHYRVVQLLNQFGFSAAEQDYVVKDLSGGQQNRLMFARAMINEPNLILFDEPTNHLDLKTLVQFEQHLKQLKAGFILISHDREFLDAVTNHTVFLRDKRAYHFKLSYSAAKEKLEEADKNAEQRLKAEEKNIKRLTESAKRLATWGKVYDSETFAAKAKNMEKRIEKLEQDKTFVSRGSDLNLTLDMAKSKANRMLQIENYAVLSPSDAPLFMIEDFFVRPGDRIALLGHNGTGKTTLINKIVAGFKQNRSDDADQKDIWFNPQCELGYYDQELQIFDTVTDDDIIQTLRQHCLTSDEETLKNTLIRAGFAHKDFTKKVSLLSGGEKSRIMFLIIKLNKANFLILDEPTNHIDIEGKEQLEAQILNANGTCLITSHDRRFLDNVADRYLVIQNGKLEELNDPNTFYQSSLIQQAPAYSDDKENQQGSVQPDRHEEDDTEQLLERIVKLETLLEEDKARKPKFQKPKQQDAWQDELTKLNEQLEAL